METKYKVQRNYSYGWDDAFFSENETPTLFDNKADAEQEIQGHIEDIKEAIKLGNMDKDSLEEREDFRIVNIDNETINDLFGTIVEFYNRWDCGLTTPKENHQFILNIKKMLTNY